MRTHKYRRASLLTCGIPVLLVVVPAMTIRREIRQEERNRALITAIKTADAQTVRNLLDRGADPDACETPPQQFSLWRFLRDRLWNRNGTHAGTPVLALGVSGVRSPYEDAPGYARGVAVVKALLDHGAHVDSKDAEGVDLINLAVGADYDAQVLRLLIQHLSNVSHRAGKDQPSLLDMTNPINGRTPSFA